MQNIEGLLRELAAAENIDLIPPQTQQFQRYAELLLEWNEKINLTAIQEPQAIVVKHFLDSLLLLPYLQGVKSPSFIDVGTGAGFPGVPLAIMRPDLRLTLLDSLNKRLLFLQELTASLGVTAHCVHARAEEGGRQAALRQRFDFVAARAVAPLNLLCEYCLPFLKRGGLFLAMKGPDAEKECHAAAHAMQELGCTLEKTVRYSLPGGDGRTLLLIRRTAALPARYPRHGSKIAKQPL